MAKKKTPKIHLVVVLTLLIIIAFFGYRYFTSQERQRAEAGLFPVVGVLMEAGCIYFDIDGNEHDQKATDVPVMTLHTGDQVLSHLTDHNPYLDTILVTLFGQDVFFYFGNLSLDQLKQLAKLHPGIAATAKQSEDVVKVLEQIFPFQINDLEQVRMRYENQHSKLAGAQQHNIDTISSYIGGSTYKDLEKQMADIEKILEEVGDQIAFLEDEEEKFLSFLTADIFCKDIGVDVS